MSEYEEAPVEPLDPALFDDEDDDSALRDEEDEDREALRRAWEQDRLDDLREAGDALDRHRQDGWGPDD